jgi:hypothetical protein
MKDFTSMLGVSAALKDKLGNIPSFANLRKADLNHLPFPIAI